MARHRYKGFKDLLDVLDKEVVNRAKDALEEGADLVVDDAKSRVPVKTGKLRDSIHYVVRKERTRIDVVANAKNKGFPYGRIVEFSPKINQPFLFPAADANREKIKQLIIDAIRKGVDHAVH